MHSTNCNQLFLKHYFHCLFFKTINCIKNNKKRLHTTTV
ncbi:hypothetical protein PAGA_a1478 [Pseudoalteromonas agarivorans DSM 14585]|uniref:Uncharacterized protein n=1 Tax=Pseudoalteromonas agarivorans DSM 14585 TaxID=1312369 RepID=A0ACA8DV86_9GAMM|nr:hypothetical protein PAGA_a1478 [Pseudoalteromonas agarivorans DSM 14585]